MNRFFSDISELSEYAPGVDSSIELITLKPSFRTSRQKITEMVTQPVWEKVAEERTEELFENFLSAIANRMMYEHSIFLAVAKNAGEQKLYKYQHEEIKDTYVSNFWAAMNNILQYLDSHPDYAGWQESKHYKDRQKLIIKSAEEFDHYYAIDSSPYFYYKVQFLIRKIYSDEIKSRVKKISLLQEETEFAYKVKRALCYHVMAEAVMTFDLTELPRSIRYDFNHEYEKTGSIPQSREKLNDYFMKQVLAWYKAIETEISLSKECVDIEISDNKEENNYYFMS